MNNRGMFLTIEGSEGVGKSTASRFIRKYLQKKSVDFVATREPGGTVLAEKLRRLLLQNHEEKISDVTELLLMFAGRKQNIDHVILPALEQGKWVVSDRFTDATFAYQGGGRGISESLISQLENIVQEGLQPDVTLLLDAPLDISLARARGRSKPDRIEQEKVAFFERVREAYLARAELFPERFYIINTNCSFTDVREQITKVMDGILEHQGIVHE